MNKDFVARLNKTFDHASMAEVARRLGIPHATVRNYYQGRLPAPEVLVKIGRETGVSLNWLLDGRGEMYAGDAPPLELGRFLEGKIVEIVDRRLAERGFYRAAEFDVASAISRSNDPQAVMAEWLRFEGREYPSDYGVVFFKGWDGFTGDERVAAIRDAKRALDEALSGVSG
jgi:transcriptional regulator with XRE-family HTH domain